MACGCSKGKSRTTPRTINQPGTGRTRVVREQSGSAPRLAANTAPSSGLGYVVIAPDGTETSHPTLMAAQQYRRTVGKDHRIESRRTS